MKTFLFSFLQMQAYHNLCNNYMLTYLTIYLSINLSIYPSIKLSMLGHRSHHGGQGLHLRRVQEGKRQLPCKFHIFFNI